MDRMISAGLLATLLLAGCGAGGAAEPGRPAPATATAAGAGDEATPAATPTSGAVEEPPPSPQPAPPAYLPDGVPLPDPPPAPIAALIDGARDDLARRTGVAKDSIEVVTALAVVWPDGGLGCPRPGIVYPQVQVDGLFVQLRAAGELYNYHGDSRRLSLCEQRAVR